jgi:hypothetical protein
VEVQERQPATGRPTVHRLVHGVASSRKGECDMERDLGVEEGVSWSREEMRIRGGGGWHCVAPHGGRGRGLGPDRQAATPGSDSATALAGGAGGCLNRGGEGL